MTSTSPKLAFSKPSERPDAQHLMPKLPKSCTHYFYNKDDNGIIRGFEVAIEVDDSLKISIARFNRIMSIRLDTDFYSKMKLVEVDSDTIKYLANICDYRKPSSVRCSVELSDYLATMI